MSHSASVRFAPRVDRWVVVLVGIALVAMIAAGVAPLFDPAATASDLMATLGTALAVVVVTVALTVPTRYEMQRDTLHVQAGLVRQTVPLTEVVRVETHMSPLASPTSPWTSRRIRVVTVRGRRVDVGPEDRTGFMAELLARAPQLEERVVGARRVWLDPART